MREETLTRSNGEVIRRRHFVGINDEGPYFDSETGEQKYQNLTSDAICETCETDEDMEKVIQRKEPILYWYLIVEFCEDLDMDDDYWTERLLLANDYAPDVSFLRDKHENIYMNSSSYGMDMTEQYNLAYNCLRYGNHTGMVD